MIEAFWSFWISASSLRATCSAAFPVFASLFIIFDNARPTLSAADVPSYVNTTASPQTDEKGRAVGERTLFFSDGGPLSLFELFVSACHSRPQAWIYIGSLVRGSCCAVRECAGSAHDVDGFAAVCATGCDGRRASCVLHKRSFSGSTVGARDSRFIFPMCVRTEVPR